ncbi:MAG: hypothetical protein QM831_04395 [Kofleriaceae bacterium]
MTTRPDRARLLAIVERCELDFGEVAGARDDGDALALEIEGELALRWRLVVVRAAIANPPDGDAVRELYGELVDRYRDDPASLALVKPLGEQIKTLEAAGELASTMVARSDRRRKPE